MDVAGANSTGVSRPGFLAKPRATESPSPALRVVSEGLAKQGGNGAGEANGASQPVAQNLQRVEPQDEELLRSLTVTGRWMLGKMRQARRWGKGKGGSA